MTTKNEVKTTEHLTAGISVKFAPAMREQLASVAAEEGVKRSDIIRLAVRDYLTNRQGGGQSVARSKSNYRCIVRSSGRSVTLVSRGATRRSIGNNGNTGHTIH